MMEVIKQTTVNNDNEKYQDYFNDFLNQKSISKPVLEEGNSNSNPKNEIKTSTFSIKK